MDGPGTLQFQFAGVVWLDNAKVKLYFISLPTEMSAEILDLIGNSLNLWGTVPVDVTVGDFTWASSMFPRTGRKCYDLPLNARVRKRLKLEAGQHLDVTIKVPLPL